MGINQTHDNSNLPGEISFYEVDSYIYLGMNVENNGGKETALKWLENLQKSKEIKI